MDYNFAQSLGISPNKEKGGKSLDGVYESIFALVLARFARINVRHIDLRVLSYRFVNWLQEEMKWTFNDSFSWIIIMNEGFVDRWILSVFGGLATSSTVNNLPEKIDEKMFTLHLKHRPWKTYNNSYSLWGNNCYCASVNVNPLKAFYIASQPQWWNHGVWQKNCCVNSYYGKIGVEKFERES